MNASFSRQEGMRLMRVVMFTLTLSSMSILMFNFVLPEISESFHLTTAQVSWVTSAYSLIYGIGTVIYGKLADRYKLKNILTVGLLVLAAGSLLGVAAQSFSMVLAARCLQASGAAAIPASAMLIPLRYFPPEQRGYAMGTAFVGLALGSALGPVVSALMVSIVHWRWLFCIPLLLLLTLPFYRKYLGDEEGSSVKIDWIGGFLLAAAVTLLLLSVTNGSWWLLLGGMIGLGLFSVRILTADQPFVQPGLFKNKQYIRRLIIAFMVSGIGFSIYFLSPLFLAQVHHLPPGWISMAMVPAALTAALLGQKGGRLADRKGNTYLYFIASSLIIICFALLSTFIGVSPLWIAFFLVIGQVGQTFITIAISNAVSTTLPKEHSGVGMGLLSMLNFIAGGMASGVYGKIVDLGAEAVWNPINIYKNGAVYSNLFLVLAVIHVLILMFYLAIDKELLPLKSDGIE
ncbi:MFS transporter [Anoxybacillus tepidamans]|uniref:MFS transporter n=1 Tax=Anoxybacteroides tepidamans TaxID=265948 RepID=UPI00048914C2|nr:MFS transporter [Anoxybacillus tepidamans]